MSGLFINIGTDPVSGINALNVERKSYEDVIKEAEERIVYIDYLLGALDNKASKEKRK